MGALAEGESTLSGASESEDSFALLYALKQLGVSVTSDGDTLKIKGTGGHFTPFRGIIDVKDAGTAMRFLTALCALVPGQITLDGSARMRQRPIGELVEALRSLGTRIDYGMRQGLPPITIHGGTLRGGRVSLHGDVSSQYITALLLIAPVLEEDLIVDVITPQVSSSYIDMTLDGLNSFGVRVKHASYQTYTLNEHAGRYAPTHYRIEGDASGASYFWAIAALTGSTIRVRNIHPSSSQGDVRFPDLLASMGCNVEKNTEEQWIEVTGAPSLRAITADMTATPDTAQTLAVVASFAQGASLLTGLSSLQIKETKRLTALQRELSKMGIQSAIGNDFIKIYGGRPMGSPIATYGDHRMAMSFAVAGTKIPNIRIEYPDVVKKSFPHFWDQLAGLGISLEKKA
jgi:3-phosphoshikimate 1-carboxyvinyltransferase